MIKRYIQRIRHCKEQWEKIEAMANETGYGGVQYLHLVEKVKILEKYRNIGIYGTGSHTIKLIKLLKRFSILDCVKCIIDENATQSSFINYTLYNNLDDAINEKDLDVIIISSLKFEKEIYNRLFNKVPNRVKLFRLYDDYYIDAEERVYFDDDDDLNIKEIPYMWKAYEAHLNRYCFAKAFVCKKNVLDIACGSGYGSAILAQNASKVTGGDISADAICFAKKHYQANNIEFIQECVENINMESGVDVIVSFETIEHIANEKEYFDAIIRNLSANGIFIVSTPLAENDGQNPYNKYHVNEYSKERFKNTLEGIFKKVDYYRQEYSHRGAICVDDGEFVGGQQGDTYIIAVCYK